MKYKEGDAVKVRIGQEYLIGEIECIERKGNNYKIHIQFSESGQNVIVTDIKRIKLATEEERKTAPLTAR